MLKTLLKGLLLSFGGGLALGAGFKLGRNFAARHAVKPGADLDPLQSEVKDLRERIDAADRNSVAQIAGLERKVGEKVQDLENRLQNELHQAHERSMEALVQAIQGAVVQRISAVETSLIEQSQAIGSLREASLRTDQNLRKMLEGIEKLQEQRAKIPARISNSASSDNGGASSEQDSAGPLPGAAETATASARWRVPLIVSAFLVPFVLLGLLASGVFPRGAKPGLTPAPEISAVPDTGDLQRLRALLSTRPSDESLLLKLGREYVVRKDWTRAEDAYRSVLRSSPRNREALLELSNVLYQQQKYEESVAVLNRLSGGTTRSR